MVWKVLITARTLNEVGAGALDLLRKAGCEVIIPPKFGPLPAEALLPLLPAMDAVLASMDKFTADVLSSDAAATLKIISRWGVGYDMIDTDALTEAGIVLCITPNAVRRPVAEAILALIFALLKNLPEQARLTRAGKWRGDLTRLDHALHEIEDELMSGLQHQNAGAEDALADLLRPLV